MSIYEVSKLISEARRIAAEYRRTTGTSLPITSEIARHDACQLLELEAEKDPQAGYDARDRQGRRMLIKGRAIFDEGKGGQRLGQMKMEQPWDALVMVLMDENFETTEIYIAARDVIEETMLQSANSNRSKRGAISVARFRHLGELVWTQETGRIDGASIWLGQP